MALRSLGYVGVAGTDGDEWASYATKFLGLQLAERTATSLAFRVDDRRHRFLVELGAEAPERFFGWEVANAAEFDAVAARLEAGGVHVTRQAGLAARRGVADIIVF